MPRTGQIIDFASFHHARASAQRAAKMTSVSAVNPASLDVMVPRTACHHSSGMRSRCHHLRAADGLAPISEAIASGDAQSEITDRNDVIADEGAASIMESPIGQFVLDGKANVSFGYGTDEGEDAVMGGKMSETEAKLAFIRRVRDARRARFPTQEPMLIILDLDQGTYKQYESRSYLPHRLIPKFCAATGVDIEWLLTGEGKGPGAVIPSSDGERPPKRARKAA